LVAVCWSFVHDCTGTHRDDDFFSTDPEMTPHTNITTITGRWSIERFHYVLKQGCAVERLQLETAARLANAVAVYSQVAVRLLRLTDLARVEPEAAVEQEFTPEEVRVLEGCRQRQEKGVGAQVRTIGEAVRVIARLGGHLGRKGDGPPGAKVLWRGLRSLHERVQGYQMARSRSEDVRNE
jgi:hypothetical protein